MFFFTKSQLEVSITKQSPAHGARVLGFLFLPAQNPSTHFQSEIAFILD